MHRYHHQVDISSVPEFSWPTWRVTSSPPDGASPHCWWWGGSSARASLVTQTGQCGAYYHPLQVLGQTGGANRPLLPSSVLGWQALSLPRGLQQYGYPLSFPWNPSCLSTLRAVWDPVKMHAGSPPAEAPELIYWETACKCRAEIDLREREAIFMHILSTNTQLFIGNREEC